MRPPTTIDVDELRARLACGLQRTTVWVLRKRKPTSRTVRVAPGLSGEFVGLLDGGRWLVDVPIDKLIAYVERAMGKL